MHKHTGTRRLRRSHDNLRLLLQKEAVHTKWVWAARLRRRRDYWEDAYIMLPVLELKLAPLTPPIPHPAFRESFWKRKMNSSEEASACVAPNHGPRATDVPSPTPTTSAPEKKPKTT
eukprot:Phypoly_transcript_19339.p2 GENE.Phypoly_transcript_19339~~Phypoly_transcript_19339.p2  ORF type:complete len:117 (+),score=18.94 Phypoly_transcript_19339:58-408(+)